MGRVADFIFLGSKITADGDCSHEIKRCLLLGRKAMINLDRVLKSRHITLPTKVHLVKAMVVPVVMYGCKRWTIKKGECQRIDASELWCWRRLSETSWTIARQDSLSITNSQSLLKLMSIELMMPTKHLILCRPLLFLSSIFPSIRVFSTLCMRWPKY